MSLENQLKNYFGYNEFRHNQRDIIAAVLEKKDVFAILPTGAGKSICYQLPALIMPGIAVVISPLISLMQDQVVSLSKNGLPAAFLNSSLRHSEFQAVLNSLGDYKLLYVAPERFADKFFVEALQKITVSLFAIDEAHCISQWGHSFRPEYKKLSLLKETFPKTPIIALTATATKDVEKDILTQLKIQQPYIARASFDRPNLTLHIENKNTPLTQLKKFLSNHQNESGIIYAATRKTVDETYTNLRQHGYQVGKYHAGMSDAERSVSQNQFLTGQVAVMVATVAFGMGIHKPDIRFIVHLDMPQSIEQYYQEIGRAGRDGLPSECLMLYSSQEIIIYKLFLKDIEDPIIRRTTQIKTNKMYNLCNSFDCRRGELLKYFGERYLSPNCNGCDNCLNNTELVDITVQAQKILSCVYRLEQRFGGKYVTDVLRGAKTQSILEKGHDSLSTYGLMHDCTEFEIRDMINSLIQMQLLERTEGEYPILRWTPTSSEVTSSKRKVTVRKAIQQSVTRDIWKDFRYDKELFKELKELCQKYALEQQVPTHVIFADRILMEMATQYPITQKELFTINGFTQVKWQNYGESFLQTIIDYCRRKGIKTKTPENIKKPEKTTRSSEETIRLFKTGNTIEKIAEIRNFSINTIMDHLALEISSGCDVDISTIVSAQKQKVINETIATVGFDKLTPIKNALSPDYTFEEIRLVAAFHKRTKG